MSLSPAKQWHLRFELPARGQSPKKNGASAIGLGLFLLLFETAFSILLAGDQAAAQIINPVRRVEYSTNSGVNWYPAPRDHYLYPRDQVQTFTASSVTVKMIPIRGQEPKDDVSLGPNSRLTIPDQEQSLGFWQGIFRVLGGRAKQPAAFETKDVAGSVRGTDVIVQVMTNGEMFIRVAQGRVLLTNKMELANTITLTNQEAGKFDPENKSLRKVPYLELQALAQTFLYYPGVVHLEDIALTATTNAELEKSVRSYTEGNLPAALAEYPADREPANNPEKLYFAGLVLVCGQFQKAESLVKNLSVAEAGYPRQRQIVEAIHQVIAAVQGNDWKRAEEPSLATEWLAESYYQQSRAGRAYAPTPWEHKVYRKAMTALDRALIAAKHATPEGSTFGFGWVRRAELEFSFGRIPEAEAALAKARKHGGGNAQAVALRGFLSWARNDYTGALARFREAAALDGRLGNAWLGMGLAELRRENAIEYSRRAGLSWAWGARTNFQGLQHLEATTTVEPERSLLRSYLGKAYYDSGGLWGGVSDLKQEALEQLELAEQLDPQDPTPHLYSALIKQRENRINEAIEDLERSARLNDNRQVYRSSLLLDQDRAVRSANLAAIYRDAGMFDVSAREAARAVNSDYGNYSAHLFLANSYNELRDPRQINLRYETPWLSELLLANLLSPVGAGTLSQNVSQQEYSRLFERDRFGVLSLTEYRSRGDWAQAGSQYGNFGNSGYALDAFYRTENGQRPNSDLSQLTWSAKVKQQISPQDSVFFQSLSYDSEFGDVAQYYNQASASRTQRVTEKQEPNLFAGYHHEWAPGSHTLLLFGRLEDTLTRSDPGSSALFLARDTKGSIVEFAFHPQPADGPFNLSYQSELEAYSAELQQIWHKNRQMFVGGIRYQSGSIEANAHINRSLSDFPVIPARFENQTAEADLNRLSLYTYYQYQILDPLWLEGGLAYDRLDFPQNIDIVPITNRQTNEDQFSPKAGLRWALQKNTHLRAAYTRSLGGVFYDTSVRIEPTQIAGFNQAFRSLIPESLTGLVPGSQFETGGLALDHRSETGTYLGVESQLLRSKARREVGAFESSESSLPFPSGTPENLGYEEKSLRVTLNQLIAKEWSLGARYQVTESELRRSYSAVPRTAALGAATLIESDNTATLHQLELSATYNHLRGFFAQFQTLWNNQSHWGYKPEIEGDDFWQFNLYAGYRFPRRLAEIRLGLLNVSGRDYRLNPLNLYSELPRERTLAVTTKVVF
ncbi:MAG: hypothetical protein HY735_01180 [Verrucomicrobia bacterium]|nr:hypothetical protein [Verrucomicrobiota bacterium]